MIYLCFVKEIKKRENACSLGGSAPQICVFESDWFIGLGVTENTVILSWL